VARAGGRLYLGLDSSTQSLTAIVIEVDGADARVVFDASLSFDEAFPQYGTDHGVLPSAFAPSASAGLRGGREAVSSPVMWAEALEAILERVVASGLDVSRIAAISGSAQQHGSVYLNADAPRMLSRLDPAQPLASQVAPILARRVAPIWLDSSTSTECAEITDAVGGPGLLAQHTGSRAFERFTGPQIRKFAAVDPDGYAATVHIDLVSSYLASLLVGGPRADRSGRRIGRKPDGSHGQAVVDGCGARDGTRPGGQASNDCPILERGGHALAVLADAPRLPPARVIAWSGDNPCSLIGVGLVREGRVAISLGTSDTIFGLMKEPRVDPSGTGHVFASPTGDYMGLTCFSNGSLARERVQDAYGFTWTDFSRALDVTPAGNQGRMLIPWFEPEITPAVADPRVDRYRLSADDAAANVRAVVEAQQMAMAVHSTWMAVTIDTIHATGGAAANKQILQVMADVFGADVYRSTVSNSAALGAALRAWHGDTVAEGTPLAWETITAIAQPNAASLIAPNPARQAVYRELLPIYEACEAHALGRGPDPTPALERFAHSRA
jgi:xylulokinase